MTKPGFEPVSVLLQTVPLDDGNPRNNLYL